MTSNIYKNEIRIALITYHQEIINLLEKFPEGYTLHEFNTELESRAVLDAPMERILHCSVIEIR